MVDVSTCYAESSDFHSPILVSCVMQLTARCILNGIFGLLTKGTLLEQEMVRKGQVRRLRLV